jgi:hypothetical protein
MPQKILDQFLNGCDPAGIATATGKTIEDVFQRLREDIDMLKRQIACATALVPQEKRNTLLVWVAQLKSPPLARKSPPASQTEVSDTPERPDAPTRQRGVGGSGKGVV